MKIRWSIALLAALSAALMLVACGPADLPDTTDTTDTAIHATMGAACGSAG